MSTFDYLGAHLTCPVCGETSPDDHSTGMQTKLRAEPQLATLRVGDAFAFDFDDAEAAGYYMLRRPREGEPIRILETWDCPACGTPFNWAEVEVTDGVLTSIRAIADFEAALRRAHLVDDEARYVVADWLGEDPGALFDDPRVVTALRER